MAPIYFAFNCTDMEISMKNFLNVACLFIIVVCYYCLHKYTKYKDGLYDIIDWVLDVKTTFELAS